MKYGTRIYYTAEHKAEMWDRWQRGESINSIGRAFDRGHSSLRSISAIPAVRGNAVPTKIPIVCSDSIFLKGLTCRYTLKLNLV